MGLKASIFWNLCGSHNYAAHSKLPEIKIDGSSLDRLNEDKIIRRDSIKVDKTVRAEISEEDCHLSTQTDGKNIKITDTGIMKTIQ